MTQEIQPKNEGPTNSPMPELVTWHARLAWLWCMVKGARKSFVIWFNSLGASALVAVPILQDNLPQLQPYLTADASKHIALVLIVGNMLLRFKTNTSLAQK